MPIFTGRIKSSIIIILFLLLSLTNSYSRQLVDGWKVLQSTASGMVIEFRPQYDSLNTIIHDGTKYTELSFIGSSSLNLGSVGKPNTRFANKLLGIPSNNVNVEILESNYVDLHGILLSPVEKIDYSIRPAKTNSPTPAKTVIGRAAYSRNALLPDTLVKIDAIREVQHTIIGNLKVYPIQYNAGTRTLRKYTRFLIRVSFGGQTIKVLGSSSKISPIVQSVLNHDVMKKRISSVPPLRKVMVNSVLASGDWFKIPVTTTGIYTLSYSTLKAIGVPVDQIDPRTIKIYNNGGRMLPESINLSRPDDLIENAILVTGESDGKFDQGDQVTFYGTSPNWWKLRSIYQNLTHYHHSYTDTNFYWLTYNGNQGKRITLRTSPQVQNPFSPSDIPSHIFYQVDSTKIVISYEDASGREYYSPPISLNMPMVHRQMLYNIVENSPVTFRITGMTTSSDASSLTVSQDNVSIGTLSSTSGTDEYDYGIKFNSGIVSVFAGKAPSSGNESYFKFDYQSESNNGDGYIYWYEILYRCRPIAIHDSLWIETPDTTAALLYHIDGFSSSNVTVFDVTDPINIVQMSTTATGSSGVNFITTCMKDTVHAFYAFTSSMQKDIQAGLIQHVKNSNLHGTDYGADFIIIAHPALMSAAKRLEAYRNSSQTNQLKTVVIDVNDIYNEFSCGQFDPVAIRDFIRYAYTTWNIPPSYILLFGGGTYDYKKQRGGMFIPPYETVESLNATNSYPYDDFYVTLTKSESITLPIGRIAARSADEADIRVDKIIRYETGSDPGSWRNLITICGDDGYTTSGYEYAQHTSEAEGLSTQHVPTKFDQQKIYLVEYPTVFASVGRLKPDATTDLIKFWNKGTLLINWTGHGNIDVWSHERLFNLSSTLPQLNNRNMLPMVFAATCRFARYDAMQRSGADQLAADDAGGAIVVIGAARDVNGSDNSTFNENFYDGLLYVTDSLELYPRVGDGFLSAKQLVYLGEDVSNMQKFHILGDPTIRLITPSEKIHIDSINNQVPVSQLLSFQALQKNSFTGTMDHSSSSAKGMDSQNQILFSILDGRKNLQITDDHGTVFSFWKPGDVVFRGTVTATNGKFKGTFIPPKDVAYSSNQGRISLYTNDDSHDAVGYFDDIIIKGADSSLVVDTTGPQLTGYIQSRLFRPGDLVPDNSTLYVDVSDEDGINLSSSSIGHGLDLWIDNDSKSISLADYFRNAPDSYQKGTIEYPLPTLTSGSHSLRIRAWDTFNNSSDMVLPFRVAGSESIVVTDVFNYPNPFSSHTYFTFQQNMTEPVDVEIRIFTVAGRLIQTLHEPNISAGFVKIPWDGTDADGNSISNGVYFYKLRVRRSVSGETFETIGKCAVLR